MGTYYKRGHDPSGDDIIRVGTGDDTSGDDTSGYRYILEMIRLGMIRVGMI